MYQDELYHHGIKGQKWGVRRYQNEDGSLTVAGRKRYGPSGEQYLSAKAHKQSAQKDYDKAFNKAYNKAIAAYSPSKKARKANDDRWNDAFEKGKVSREADKKYKEAKAQMKADRKREKLETRVSSRAEKRGASVETSAKLGKAYADRYFANKQYLKDWDRAYNSWTIGKNRKSRIDKMMESLNDYWIADESYKRASLDADSEIRKANGWR